MGQKWEKNDHRIPKNGPNMTHNLDKKCILMVFIEFQNIEIFCTIFPDFWPKIDISSLTQQKFRKKDFNGKSNLFLENGSIGP